MGTMIAPINAKTMEKFEKTYPNKEGLIFSKFDDGSYIYGSTIDAYELWFSNQLAKERIND